MLHEPLDKDVLVRLWGKPYRLRGGSNAERAADREGAAAARGQAECAGRLHRPTVHRWYQYGDESPCTEQARAVAHQSQSYMDLE